MHLRPMTEEADVSTVTIYSTCRRISHHREINIKHVVDVNLMLIKPTTSGQEQPQGDASLHLP